MEKNRLNMLLGDLGILFVALIWGTTNVVIRDALEGSPALVLRAAFAIAWATVMIFSAEKHSYSAESKAEEHACRNGLHLRLPDRGDRPALHHRRQPVLHNLHVGRARAALRLDHHPQIPGWHVVIAVLLCTAGMVGLMLDVDLSVNLGDLLSFSACVFVTIYILLVQKYVRGVDPYALTCWQALGGMLLAVSAAAIFEPFPENIPLRAWLALIHTGTVGFALTLVIQTVAQKYTNATHVAILLSTSGVFGSVAGVMFIGEPMTFRIFIASAMILAGVMIVEALPALRKKYRENGATDGQLS